MIRIKNISTASTAKTESNKDPNNHQCIKDNLLKWCQQKTQGYPVNSRFTHKKTLKKMTSLSFHLSENILVI